MFTIGGRSVLLAHVHIGMSPHETDVEGNTSPATNRITVLSVKNKNKTTY